MESDRKDRRARPECVRKHQQAGCIRWCGDGARAARYCIEPIARLLQDFHNWARTARLLQTREIGREIGTVS